MRSIFAASRDKVNKYGYLFAFYNGRDECLLYIDGGAGELKLWKTFSLQGANITAAIVLAETATTTAFMLYYGRFSYCF